jgi:hypothetical protein
MQHGFAPAAAGADRVHAGGDSPKKDSGEVEKFLVGRALKS